MLSVAGINTENEDDEASISSSSLVSLSCTPQYWTANATKYLLEIYREQSALIDKGKGTKKKRYQEISTSLQKQGYNFTWEQGQGRLKTLITNFKTIKDQSNKSGNERKTCAFYKELDELYDGNSTFCGPANTRETSMFQRKRKLTDKKEDNDKEDEEEKEETKKVEVPTIKKSKRSASNEMVDFPKDYVKAQKDAKQNEKEERRNMHAEKMDLFREMVKTFKK